MLLYPYARHLYENETQRHHAVLYIRQELARRRNARSRYGRWESGIDGMPLNCRDVLTSSSPRRGWLCLFTAASGTHTKTVRTSALPSSNVDYWNRKIEGNRKRDRRVRDALRSSGWRTAVIWECKLKNLPVVACRLERLAASSRKKLR